MRGRGYEKADGIYEACFVQLCYYTRRFFTGTCFYQSNTELFKDSLQKETGERVQRVDEMGFILCILFPNIYMPLIPS